MSRDVPNFSARFVLLNTTSILRISLTAKIGNLSQYFENFADC